MRSVLREHGVEVVLRVAPRLATLTRVAQLPAETSDRAALADALALVAESELPAGLPWYRRAGGVVTGREPTRAIGLLVGWNPGRPAAPVAAAEADGSGRGAGGGGGSASSGSDALAEALAGLGAKVAWTTEAVAAAWLLANADRVTNGSGGTEPIEPVWVALLDRASGVATLAAAGGSTTLVRALRLPNADPDRWGAAVANAIGEACTHLGLSGRPVMPPPADSGLVTSPGLAWRLGGEQRNPQWVAEFGVPAALVGAFAPPDPASRALFNLHASEPRRRMNALVELAAWLSRPSRAAAVIGLCVALLLLVPLGVAYARHATLERHVRGVTGLEERLAAEEQRVAFYSLLRERRWPMTKLIADIATSAPQGITLDVLEIIQGEPITVRGTARSNELVTTFRENLVKTRVFESIAIPNVGSSADGVQFQLSARVSGPGVFYRAGPIDDFAARPLGARIYGDSYVPPDDDGGSGEPQRATARSGERPRSGEPAPRNAAAGSSTRSTAPAPTIPPPLTDEQLAGFTATDAMLDFARRKNAAAQAGLDAATKQRLLDESARSRARMQELNASGGKGGAK